MKQVSRYHPLLVTLHWVLAFLIIAALTIGFFWLAATPNSDPQKIGVLRVHMAGGMLILVLMLIRFIVRMRTSRPADATTGHPLLDRTVPIFHYGFYVLVILMVVTGYTTAILAGLSAIVFGGSRHGPPNRRRRTRHRPLRLLQEGRGEMNKFKDSAAKAVDSAQDAASHAGNAAKDAAQDAASEIKEAAGEVKDAAVKAGQKAKEGTREAVNKAADKAKEAVK